MAPRKILFFSLVGLTLIALMIGAWKLSHMTPTIETTAKRLNIWIVGDATEGFSPIVEGFKKKYPQYKNTKIEFTKFGSYDEYQKTLLSVLADGNGPDIFVVDAGKDKILESKIEPIPETVMNIDDILKRYDPIFFSTLIKEVEDPDTKIRQSFVMGIPLGYETLGIFYNKTLFPTLPTTWSELDIEYNTPRSGYIPAALGFGPRYIQQGVELISVFLLFHNIASFKELDKGGNALGEYLAYGNVDNASSMSPILDTGEISQLPENESKEPWITYMEKDNTTMTDLFIQGKVGMVFGFPSLVRELEYAKKRAGEFAQSSLILTAPLLRKSLDTPLQNIGRYYYFGISKASQNGMDALNFLTYLASEEAEALYLEAFPLYIAAQTSFHENQKNTSLSNTFTRAKLGSFINSEQSSTVFEYGIWSEFEEGIYKIIDRDNNININKKLTALGKQIQCQLDQTLYQINIGKNCSSPGE